MVGEELEVKSCLGAAFICYIAYWIFSIFDIIRPNIKFIAKLSQVSKDPSDPKANLQNQQPKQNVGAVAMTPKKKVTVNNESFVIGERPDSRGVVMMNGQPYVVEGTPGAEEVVMVENKAYTYARSITEDELTAIRANPHRNVANNNRNGEKVEDNKANISESHEEMRQPYLGGDGNEWAVNQEIQANNEGQQNADNSKPAQVNITNTDNIGKYENDQDPVFSQIVHRFPKTIIWYFLVLAFTATRASTEFGIVMCYLSLIGRAVQVVGIVIKKPIVSWIGYGLSLIILIP